MQRGAIGGSAASRLTSPRHLSSGAYLLPWPNGYHLRPVNQRNTIPGQPFYHVHHPNIGRNKGVNLPLRRARANCGAGSCRHNQAMTAIYRAVAVARPPNQGGGRGEGRALPCTMPPLGVCCPLVYRRSTSALPSRCPSA